MKATNFNQDLRNYVEAKRDISYNELGQLLMIDNLYEEIPDDIDNFREIYSHFDPNAIDDEERGIIFLDIAASKEPDAILKHRLNSYFNVKSYFIDNYKSYEENMERLKRACYYSSVLIDDLLRMAKLPDEVIETLRESDIVRDCNDFFELLQLYRKTKSKRIKFEILRKLGLIVMMKRIRRTYLIDEVDFAADNVKKLFRKGLGITNKEKKTYYAWLGSNNELHYMQNKKQATKHYEKSLQERKKLGMPIYPLQNFVCHPGKTSFGNYVLHQEVRNKFRENGNLNYTSFVEKMVRKNLKFPNMVRDVIGVRIVVETEEEIPQLVKDMENFLGGTSTRKNEKNGLNRYGRKRLSKYSSEDYYVWKAVYDITLPNPSISFLNKLFSQVNGDQNIMEMLKQEKARLEETPRDFVVEVQIQDLSSYLLSIAHGSSATHEMLKTKQIRYNSFYKFFPKEIYKEELGKLKRSILLG